MSEPNSNSNSNITQEIFGTTAAGQTVDRFILRNANGVEVSIINLGGIIQSIWVPDQNGTFDDVVLGYDTLAEYETCSAFFGCIAGRYANRIAKGRFTLDGKAYALETNNGENHLHGGSAGFNRVVWEAEIDETVDEPTLALRYVSADGEGGYPGELTTTVRYSLSAQNELRIEYQATTDQPTILNLTNHSYFNLLGQQHATKNSVLDHKVMLNAPRYIPTDAVAIPLGHLADVGGTPMDFRTSTSIGARIDHDEEQLRFGMGYDHTWVFEHERDASAVAARVVEPTSGRWLETYTTQPGVQFYTANHMLPVAGKQGAQYDFRSGFCLETQHFPDSPNQPNFPSTVLRPGEIFSQATLFKFGTVN